jgi:hypothetical protein
MVFSHRRAPRARLLLIRLRKGQLRIDLSTRRVKADEDKVMAGETPANPATLVAILFVNVGDQVS